jgi:hypothetical protein
MPQVSVKKRKAKEATEGLERSRRLAKQVLSQLSYTPTFVSIILILKHLAPLENSEEVKFIFFLRVY